ncbi:MAG: undecaprenyl-diphosphate phosphatase [candidate division WOR-3 bacterium]
MELYKALLLGAIQGLTEILPVSSDGHLAVLLRLLRYHDGSGLYLTAVLHLGTGLALMAFFLPQIFSMLRCFFSRNVPLARSGRLLVGRIALALAPVVAVGLLVGDCLERLSASKLVVVACFATNGIILIVTTLARDRNRSLDWTVASVVGLAQVFALLPGISRSGVTIATALLLGVSVVEAFEFSFLLAVPVTLGAGVLALLKESSRLPGAAVTTVGVGGAFVFGLVGLFLLRRLVKAGRLSWFGFYCLVLAAMLLIC